MKKTRGALALLAGLLVVPVAGASSASGSAGPRRPHHTVTTSEPRQVTTGTFLGVVGGGLRLVRVEVPAGPPFGRFLTVSPEGTRVAFGDEAGLLVIGPGGAVRSWSSDSVRGQPAWSPGGTTLAYPTGAADALAGELRVVRAGDEPRTVAPSVVTFTPVGFAADRPGVALLATAPGADPTDPGAHRVVEVAFGHRSPAGLTTPVAYAGAAFEAWQARDAEALARLAEPGAAALATDRPPRPDEAWSGPACEGAAGSTYCTWNAEQASLTLRVANEVASTGGDHGVIEAFFGPPPGGVGLWPLTTRAEAENTQEQVDQGHSPWMLDPEAVADSFARAELGWSDVDVTVVDPSTVRVSRPGVATAVALTLVQPARSGPGGIWVIIRAGSTA